MSKLVSSWTASVLLKPGRQHPAERRGQRFAKLAEEARLRITEISVSETAAAIKRGALLIDVREKEDFLRGHIPNAIHLPRRNSGVGD